MNNESTGSARPEPPARTRLPGRSTTYGVGKEIGGAVYLHYHYEHKLGDRVQFARTRLPAEFVYTIVKFKPAGGVVSFVRSPDFDTAPEPTVGDIWIVWPDGRTRFLRQQADPHIYHHKWLMVADDYSQFDVQESRDRSILWLSLPGIDSSRIGRKRYWSDHILPRLRDAAIRPPLVIAQSRTIVRHPSDLRQP